MNWYRLPSSPVCAKENVIQGDGYRITMLTECFVRLEYSENNHFEDHATQTVLNRDFAPVSYSLSEEDGCLEITTNRLHITYDKKKFSASGLCIQLRGATHTHVKQWHYGELYWNLGGTARTLDGVDGACRIGDGVIGKNGFAVLDDSKSLLLTDNGWIAPRKEEAIDIYFFGHGRDYLSAIKDFYRLCGKTPMIPRYALGNWWSRYYQYTEESYKALMNRFEEEKVPFSVAVIDMDWHLVQIDPKYGSGWTGYTWNREFFPDPDRFLQWIHERGMKVTLNVHPADGVRGHEEMYPQMAAAMGVDAEKEEPVQFDIASEQFMNAYFTYVNHPYEERGVDFWWLDWQQGTSSKLKGLDPLWMLNHYHYLDSGRDGKRPMTFSRYAGAGSHRYPIGFSGDTVITWESLHFQPYFTSTASNIGYGWWSHDIGGHMGGYKDDEMEARWYQLGVFSPINRLHSSNNPFSGKEPWRYRADVRQVTGEFLRLRHKLIPYIYTMNYRAYKEDLPLIQPMYYKYPNDERAYEVRNQYYFGSELMVAPITTKHIEGINRAKVKVWLPEGNWNDFFTGMHYEGGRYVWMYRPIDSIPVLAKDGAIIPLTEEISPKEASKNPEQITIRMFSGADGTFTLYEDGNDTTDYEKDICVKTNISLNWAKREINIQKPKGDLSLIPQKRQWTIELVGVANNIDYEKVNVWANGKQLAIANDTISYKSEKQTLSITLVNISSDMDICIQFTNANIDKGDNQVRERIIELIDCAEVSYYLKESIYNAIGNGTDIVEMIRNLQVIDISSEWMTSLCEFML